MDGDTVVGTAILYRLYIPLAENNVPKIQAWMSFYKHAYRVIALVIALLGLCLIPFLPMLIKGYEKFNDLGISAVLIFCLFLFKSVSSYLFFAYRSAIVKADQKHPGFVRAVEWCKAHGKEVVELPRTPGISSSDIKTNL